LASRARSPASGPGAAPDPAHPAIPATNGPISSGPSAPHVAPRQGWSCRPSPPRR
jgi:hypothetical protein